MSNPVQKQVMNDWDIRKTNHGLEWDVSTAGDTREIEMVISDLPDYTWLTRDDLLEMLKAIEAKGASDAVANES